MRRLTTIALVKGRGDLEVLKTSNPGLKVGQKLGGLPPQSPIPTTTAPPAAAIAPPIPASASIAEPPAKKACPDDLRSCICDSDHEGDADATMPIVIEDD